MVKTRGVKGKKEAVASKSMVAKVSNKKDVGDKYYVAWMPGVKSELFNESDAVFKFLKDNPGSLWEAFESSVAALEKKSQVDKVRRCTTNCYQNDRLSLI
jgi:hypothetical protein